MERYIFCEGGIYGGGDRSIMGGPHLSLDSPDISQSQKVSVSQLQSSCATVSILIHVCLLI